MRRVAALATASGRQRQGRFMVEGPRAVLDLLRAVRAGVFVAPVVEVYATGAEFAQLELGALTAELGVPLVEVSDRVARRMADAATPQGVIAVVGLPDDTTYGNPSHGFGALLLRAQDPGNVGTVIRAADAAGAGVVLLGPATADPYAPKAVRAAVGSLFHVPVRRRVDLAQARDLPGPRPVLLALDAAGGTPLDELVALARRGEGPLRGPHLWVLGNEGQGLDDTERAAVDTTVCIPIRGRAESLNLAMAATLALFASAGATAG